MTNPSKQQWITPRVQSLDVARTLSADVKGCFETFDGTGGTLIITGGVGGFALGSC